ncbi:MAG: hypothetical protein DMF84_11585 [Acidobacteria bacterium]|nr:MAG: hypothetical protein DMF84_11585 [Acidobacteriota bacterium]
MPVASAIVVVMIVAGQGAHLWRALFIAMALVYGWRWVQESRRVKTATGRVVSSSTRRKRPLINDGSSAR